MLFSRKKPAPKAVKPESAPTPPDAALPAEQLAKVKAILVALGSFGLELEQEANLHLAAVESLLSNGRVTLAEHHQKECKRCRDQAARLLEIYNLAA